MGRCQDRTGDAKSVNAVSDKTTDYRMFQERGKSDKAHTSYEGDRMMSELDGDAPHDDRNDQNKLRWATDVLRRIIDDKWW